MSFDLLNLHPKIQAAVDAAGYKDPTPIQLKVIPKIQKGHDVRASAHTGTGKTAAFLLPAIERLLASPQKGQKAPRVLILSPTRELAMQIEMQAKKYCKFLPHLKTACIVGGVPYGRQERQLSRPLDLLIATPGRLIDFLQKRKVQLSQIEMLVLDEADRMLDMGFVKPVEDIVAKTPSTRQTLLFSATLHGSVIKLSEKLLKNPMEIKADGESAHHASIEQKIYITDNLGHKNQILNHLLEEDTIFQAIIFTATKRHADLLAKELNHPSYKIAALHGDMSQRKRTHTIEKFKTGKIHILVATDVAARGIDVASLSHVINFDFPENTEDYIHRIGRTGRGSATGQAISFVNQRDVPQLKRIESFMKKPFETCEITGLEPRLKASPQKPKKRAPHFNPRKKRKPSSRFSKKSR